MKIRVRYRNARVRVDAMRPGECQACGWAGRLEFHHYAYAYKSGQVRKMPVLALDNGIWLCFNCHVLADALRKLFKDPTRSKSVIDAIANKLKEGNHAKKSNPLRQMQEVLGRGPLRP